MIWLQVGLDLAGIEALLERLELHSALHVVSPCLLAAASGFFVTVLVKVVLLAIVKHRLRWSEVVATVKSGGMPSSHSATVVGLATSVGMIDGFDSAVFALAAVFAVVVMIDATQVRRAVGEQGESLRALLARTHQADDQTADANTPAAQANAMPAPYLADGHTPPQVFVGALVGLACGILIAGIALAV